MKMKYLMVLLFTIGFVFGVWVAASNRALASCRDRVQKLEAKNDSVPEVDPCGHVYLRPEGDFGIDYPSVEQMIRERSAAQAYIPLLDKRIEDAKKRRIHEFDTAAGWAK